MRIARISAATLALAFAVTVAAALPPASAQSSQQVSKPKKKTVKRPARSARQIACTEFGCHPIPPNCRPQTGYRWDGMPSGFDVVVCR